MTWTDNLSRVVRRRAMLLILPTWLSACAMLEPQPGPGAAPAVPAAARPYHASLDIAGRLSVRYQQNGAEQAVHGSFTWVQTPESTNVTLLSPLGQVLAMITVAPNAAILRMAGQPARTADDVDALAAQALGWPLPVSGLRDWLQGYAVDKDGARFIATPPAPATVVTRDGWRVTYASWSDEADRTAQNHPRRIDLERNTAAAGNVAIRIVIDDWQPR
jgi:outer membrane lipoprotein LolB